MRTRFEGQDMTGLRSFISLAGKFRSGETTPSAYLDESLERITELDGNIAAFVALNSDGAVSAADASDSRWRAGKPLSPVDGMPIAVKDVIETADMPTGQGSPLWDGTPTRRDAAGIHALREAGAIILGKTTTTEFAGIHPFHTTRNPHDLNRTPGGSTSGSAAAVGSGMVPVGLGSQVVGSILRPASFCGAVGFKPSYGAINRGGSYDHLSQSCLGAIGATLADVWAVLQAIAIRAGGDPGFVGLSGDVNLSRLTKPIRFAVLETGGWVSVAAGARNALEAAKETLTKAGIELQGRHEDHEIEVLESVIADAGSLSRAIISWEGRWPLNTYAEIDATKLSHQSLARIKRAEAMTQKEYASLLARRLRAREIFDRVASQYDAFVTLGACGVAPLGLESTGNSAMNVAASLLGCPALTLPLMEDQGLPLGLQLLGRKDVDAALVGVATWVSVEAFGRADLVGAPR